MLIKPTQLRKDIYKILDSVIESGEPVEIVRDGKLLRISSIEPYDRLKNLKPLPGLKVKNLDTIDDIDWTKEWKP